MFFWIQTIDKKKSMQVGMPCMDFFHEVGGRGCYKGENFLEAGGRLLVKVGNFHETDVGLLAKVKIFLRRMGAC